MKQAVSPEFQAAADALRKRISLTEAEIAPLQEIVHAKQRLILDWRYAINMLVPGSEPDRFGFGALRRLSSSTTVGGTKPNSYTQQTSTQEIVHDSRRIP